MIRPLRTIMSSKSSGKGAVVDARAQFAERDDRLLIRANHVGQRVRGKCLRREGGDAQAANVGVAGERGLEIAARRGERRRIARIGPGHRSRERAASSTVRASGPIESSVPDSGTAP